MGCIVLFPQNFGIAVAIRVTIGACAPRGRVFEPTAISFGEYFRALRHLICVCLPNSQFRRILKREISQHGVFAAVLMGASKFELSRIIWSVYKKHGILPNEGWYDDQTNDDGNGDQIKRFNKWTTNDCEPDDILPGKVWTLGHLLAHHLTMLSTLSPSFENACSIGSHTAAHTLLTN